MSLIRFLLAYDFDRPEKEILCDLIYISNGYRLQPPIVEFGRVMELDQRPDIEDDPNSFIEAEVNPKFDHRLVTGETGYLYTRIPLGVLTVQDGAVIQPPPIPFKTHDILEQINEQLGTRLSENDLENIEYTTLDDDFIIRSSPQSKVWIGWRYIQVEGGGQKNKLYPTVTLQGFKSADTIGSDKTADLTDLANALNRVGWREMIDFDFDVETLEAGVIGAGGRNTRILIRAHRQGYIDQWLYYTRIDPKTINNQFAGGDIPPVVIADTAFTVYGILAQINSTLNLHLTADDVENAAFLPGLDEYPITFKKTSIGWLPGTYTVKVSYTPIEIDRVRLIGDGGYRYSSPEAVRTYA